MLPAAAAFLTLAATAPAVSAPFLGLQLCTGSEGSTQERLMIVSAFRASCYIVADEAQFRYGFVRPLLPSDGEEIAVGVCYSPDTLLLCFGAGPKPDENLTPICDTDPC